MNPLPPQAYTKDILLKAYQWLMLQNSSIKEMATTPDILVSLYLKTTRDGEHALDRPSIQNFKNELRSLAGMMGELDRPPQAAPVTAPSMPSPAPAPAPAPTRMMPPIIETPPMTATPTAAATIRKADLLEQLDSCSRTMIHEVKEEFNLSSDVEALRMLIKVGYTRSKNLLS
ncbi:hypothetical protein [Bdellovibrio bacteriovorus]|nr:hypothetical protein [Bdellovibrio bacteriovorus]